jgi:O-antigen/teichoic acid export membrane protein
MGEQRRLLRIVAVGAAVNVAGNALFIQRFGLWGAVASTCVFQPAVSLATIWLAQRAIGGAFPLNRVTAATSLAALYLGAIACMHRYWGAIAALILVSVAMPALDHNVRQSCRMIWRTYAPSGAELMGTNRA